jgi:REP element-mobilizing transposase RayT
LEAHRRKLMKQPAYWLDAKARGVVDAAIREHCDHKGWDLWALNVRTNHFHAVVPPSIDGGKVLGAMKARATRMLRQKGVVAPDRLIWTRRGGITLLLTADEVSQAVRYVIEGRGPMLAMG